MCQNTLIIAYQPVPLAYPSMPLTTKSASTLRQNTREHGHAWVQHTLLTQYSKVRQYVHYKESVISFSSGDRV